MAPFPPASIEPPSHSGFDPFAGFTSSQGVSRGFPSRADNSGFKARTDTSNAFFNAKGYPRARPRCPDVEHTVSFSLAQVFKGEHKTLRLKRKTPCVSCKGAKTIAGKRCAACRGIGCQEV
jgi:DnaJ-class molecular chaperone